MKNQLEVPQAALRLRNAEGRELDPQPKDPVSFHVEGTIRSVRDGYCIVEVAFINGQRPGPPEIMDEEEGLREQAAAADMEMGGITGTGGYTGGY